MPKNALALVRLGVLAGLGACSSPRADHRPPPADDCYDCHGERLAGNNAPPPAFWRQDDPDAGGAHQSHLGASDWRGPIVCDDCHVVPGDVLDDGHVDTPLPAELTWGVLATADNAAPSWDGATCAGVYCHGSTLFAGGSNTEPSWRQVDGTQAACGTCHGLPPDAPHPGYSDCSMCHPDVDANLHVIDPDRHIDGEVTLSQGQCDSCHGSNGNPAPPRDLSNQVDTSARGVGAHRSHLRSSWWHAEVTCDACHIVPNDWLAPGHLDTDTPAEITWNALAQSDGASPSWTGTSCSGVYCHGATLLPGGTNTTPTWTRVDHSQAACGTCHGLPPARPHPQVSDCSGCHSTVDQGIRIAVPEQHINGQVEVSADIACGACHELPPATGTHLRHADLASPTYGGLGTAADLSDPTAYAFGCGHCHPLDISQHISGGRATVELYDPAAPPGSLKAQHPATASYTPGATVFVDSYGLEYTLGTCADVYCHSGMVTTSGPVPRPGADFPFVGYPIMYPSYPVSRTRAYTPVLWGGAPAACNSCHGYSPRGVWPSVDAGAGESHAYLNPDGYEDLHVWNHGYAPVPCRTCHATTITEVGTFTRSGDVTTLGPVAIAGFGAHVDGVSSVVFDTANPVVYSQPMDLSSALYDASTHTCTNVACHLYQTAVVFGAPYRWTNSAECNSCHQY